MPLPAWVDLPAFFPDPAHRIWLRRRLAGSGPPVAFVLHNPSKAGADVDDPTSRRGIGFANAWRASDLIFVNIATGIATDARALDKVAKPFLMWREAVEAAAEFVAARDGKLVAAWGTPKGNADMRERMKYHFALVQLIKLAAPLHYLRMTPSGYPEHPLYLPRHLVPIPWGTP